MVSKRSVAIRAIVSGLILLPLLLAMRGTVRGPNRAPVANAGYDQVAEPYETIALDASGSFDPDGDKLTYLWEIAAAPPGAHLRLYNRRGMKTCRLVPNRPGIWLIRLTVCDGELISIPDIMEIRVKEPAPQPPSTLPATWQPDLEVVDIAAVGLNRNRYIGAFKVKLRSRHGSFGGALGFRIIGLDRLNGGRFAFDRTVTIANVGLSSGEQEKWITLLKNEIEWPEEICQVTWGVSVDPGNMVHELNEMNNFKEKIICRDELVGDCQVRIYPPHVLMGKANLRPVPDGGRFVLPSDHVNIHVAWRNCCHTSQMVKLAFIYDWTPVTSQGENKKIWESTERFERAEHKSITYSNIEIPKKKEFKTFVIRREHDKGYDIIYSAEVKVD